MNKLKAVFFCLLFVWVLFYSTNTVFADDIDDLLNKCAIAPNPRPSVMVYDYELSPETLMPGDVGVLTITLKNMQDKPIEKDVDIRSEIKGTGGYVIDIDAETRFTMDAYIKEAYIVEREFKVYNSYSSAGVLGPDSKVDLAFKIKAPSGEGIHMLKFLADIEDMEGKSSKGIRYFIPIVVTGTVNLLLQEVFENEVSLEVINEGLSDVNGVYVVATVSNARGVECQPERVYIGKIKSGESAIAVFKVNKTEERESTTVFKAVYKNGINKHESNPVCVIIPCLHCEEEKREQEESETSFSALTVTATPTPTLSSSSSSTSALKLTDFGAVFAFVGLFVFVVAVAFAKKKR
ncbi:hypothetical protein C5S32_11540 [ANME-1 cluster archaeon GoMg1]|nr:hypothetical protein [ANME-1 cluster archaeon GoMg1]